MRLSCVLSMEVKQDVNEQAVLLFDPERPLEERILTEQFAEN